MSVVLCPETWLVQGLRGAHKALHTHHKLIVHHRPHHAPHITQIGCLEPFGGWGETWGASTVLTVPEPATWLLMTIGLIAVWSTARRRKA